MKVQEVTPIGTTVQGAFVERRADDAHCGVELVETKHYEQVPWQKELRALRYRARLTLGSAAELFETTVVEWCGLEMGSHIFINAEQRLTVFRILRDLALVRQ